MDQSRLDFILTRHSKWLYGRSDGARAQLSCQNLSGVDFSTVDLQDVDLSYSYLYNANFDCTRMRGANLVHAKGITLAQDGNYTMMLVHGDVPMIKAGCRWLTIAEADAHWAEGNEDEWTENTAEYGESQRAMLEYLKSRIK